MSPTVVEVMLVPVGLLSGEDVTLTATGATGIVAVDDGGAWAGMTGLVLPSVIHEGARGRYQIAK